MLFTARQRYQSWKNPNHNYKTIVPTLSHYDGISTKPPYYKVINGKKIGLFPNTQKANPIKHYRYQLNQTSDIPRRSIRHPVYYSHKPGSHNTLDLSNGSCCIKNPNDTSLNKISKSMTLYINKNEEVYLPDICGCVCNPESKIRWHSETLKPIPDNYITSNSYLSSRCKTFNQHNLLIRQSGIKYFDQSGVPLNPTNDNNGPQVFRIGECCNLKCNNVDTTYKAPNKPFNRPAAVAGSTRIAKLKNDVITANGNSFLTAKYAQEKNMGKYSGYSNQPCLNPNFNCQPSFYYRVGNKRICS